MVMKYLLPLRGKKKITIRIMRWIIAVMLDEANFVMLLISDMLVLVLICRTQKTSAFEGFLESLNITINRNWEEVRSRECLQIRLINL